MRTVHKFILPINDQPFDILLPYGWECALVESQRGIAAMWAVVDTERPKEKFVFRVTWTGHPVPADAIHVVSFRQPPFVWHLWEMP